MSTDPRPARDLLAVFLNDHLAAAVGGHALARRAAGAVKPSPYRDALEDAATLLGQQAVGFRGVLHGNRLREARAKQRLAMLGERAGRLKLNGRVLRPSPLSRLVELEGVLLSIEVCRQAWSALADAGIAMPEATAAVEALDRQVTALEQHREAVARQALTR